jgi:hypothetical protein
MHFGIASVNLLPVESNSPLKSRRQGLEKKAPFACQFQKTANGGRFLESRICCNMSAARRILQESKSKASLTVKVLEKTVWSDALLKPANFSKHRKGGR